MIKRYLFICFVLFFTKGYGQKAKAKVVYETIVVYDTVTVYDTIVVYDTIKTENKVQSENNFKNNFTAEKAYLAIDTSDFSAAVLLINKKDTATLSINSIILSETNKNLDTMKKSLLTLLAVAALSQANFAQETGTLTNSISSQTEISQPIVEDSLASNKWSLGFGVAGNGSLFGMRASTLREVGLSNLGGNIKFDYLINKKWSVGLKFIFARFKQPDYYEIFDGLEYYTQKFNPGYSLNSSIVSTYYLLGNNQSCKRGLYITQGFGYAEFSTSDTQFSTKNRYSTEQGIPYGQGTFKHYERQQFFSGLISLGADFSIGPGRLYVEIPVSISIYNERSFNVLTPNGGIPKNGKGFSVSGTSAFINIGYAFSF